MTKLCANLIYSGWFILRRVSEQHCYLKQDTLYMYMTLYISTSKHTSFSLFFSLMIVFQDKFYKSEVRLIRDYILVKTKSTFFRSRGTLDFLQAERDSTLCTYIYDRISANCTFPSLLATITYVRQGRATLTGPWTLAPKFSERSFFPRRLFPFPSFSTVTRVGAIHPPSTIVAPYCPEHYAHPAHSTGCVASRRAVHTSRGGENGSIVGVASRSFPRTMERRQWNATRDASTTLCFLVVVDRRTDEHPVDDCAPRGRDPWQRPLASRVASRRRGGWMSRRRQRRRPDVGRRVLSPERRRRTRGEKRRRLFSLHAASRRNPARVHRALVRLPSLSRSSMKSSTFPQTNRSGGWSGVVPSRFCRMIEKL